MIRQTHTHAKVGIDASGVRRAFERNAAVYASLNGPDQEIGQRLVEHLEPVRINPGVIIDIGTGAGGCARRLLKTYRKARVIAVDMTSAMLCESRRREPFFRSRQSYVCSDAHELGIRTDTADLIYSNLTLPWCADPDRVFAELGRVLKPGGLLALSTLGPDTLRELRTFWRQVDEHEHVHVFIDMHDVGDALVRAGFIDVVMDTEVITLQYQCIDALFADLKQLGAGNLSPGRRRTLSGRGKLTQLRTLYGETAPINATMEVTYAHAWTPLQKGSKVPLVEFG